MGSFPINSEDQTIQSDLPVIEHAFGDTDECDDKTFNCP